MYKNLHRITDHTCPRRLAYRQRKTEVCARQPLIVEDTRGCHAVTAIPYYTPLVHQRCGDKSFLLLCIPQPGGLPSSTPDARRPHRGVDFSALTKHKKYATMDGLLYPDLSLILRGMSAF